MTSTLTPGARIWRGGVPTLLPGTGFQGGGEVGDAGSDPYVAPPSEDYTDVRMVDTAWTSLFDVHKDDLRLGAETARREGYSGIPDMKPYEMNRYWESPEGLRNAGAEMYSRILHSEDPSKYTLSRAMMLDDDDLAKIRVGEPYSLPLSSFGSEDFATRYLYPDESLMFESAEREGKNIPVMLKLLKGAKTTSVAEEGLSGRIGPPLESVTLGNFDVVSIKDVDRGGGHKYKEITIRQKDIGPAPIETTAAPTGPSLEQFGDIETGKGRWQFPYKGSYDVGLGGDKIHQFEIAPTDAPESYTGTYYDRQKTLYYDPQRASVEQGEFGPQANPVDPNAITDYREINADTGKLWRGMSDEEYQQAQERGYFESDRSYNLVTDNAFQADKTFFSTDFTQAANYSTGFAPWQAQPTFSKPAHVIGISDQPDLPRGPLGTEPTSSEVGVPGQIPFDSVTDHYVGNVISVSPGEIKGLEDYSGFGEPSRSLSPRSTVQWEKGDIPPTTVGKAGAIPKDDLIKESLKGINERGGITIDLAGHQPGEGYGYAPSKTTEKMFEAGTITPEDVDAYIDSHFEELQREGMHFGAWVAEDTKDVYLDVSKVGAANAETLRAAMEAEQLAVWDFGAPIELGELNIGRIDEQGKYHRLGKASDLHAEHARQVQRAIESRSAGSTSEVPGRPAAGELAVEKPASKAKPLKEKALKEGRGRTRAAGPGSARKPPTAMETTTDVLGKAGRVLGPIATVAGDVYTAYGLVGQAAEQGQEEELAQGHVIAQGPKVLGIPTGKAFADPTFKSGQSTAGRSKADIDYWLKHGKWPETSTGPESLIGTAGRQTGGLPPGALIWKQGKPVDQTPQPTSSSQQGLQMSFRVQHADGTVSRHSLDQSSPMVFAGPQIDMRPGDQFFIDGNYG